MDNRNNNGFKNVRDECAIEILFRLKILARFLAVSDGFVSASKASKGVDSGSWAAPDVPVLVHSEVSLFHVNLFSVYLQCMHPTSA